MTNLIYDSSGDSYFNNKMIELAEPGVMFDIGANHGMYLPAMSTKAEKVYAFEPEVNNYKILKENIKLENVDIVQAVASNVDGMEKLFLCANPAGHGQHTLSDGVASDPRWGHSLSNYVYVESFRLDSFAAINNIKNISAIKIDVEGAEYKVLEGSINILNQHMPIVSLETHTPGHIDLIERILNDCGYVYWSLDGSVVEHMLQDQPYFCVHKLKNISPF